MMVDQMWLLMGGKQASGTFMVRESLTFKKAPFILVIPPLKKVLIFVAAFINYSSLFFGVKYCTLAVILPSLERLLGSLEKLDICKKSHSSIDGISYGKKMMEGDGKLINIDLEREDECGICLEPCTKMVLPNCCHAMCIKCYRKWNTRSESCPFCRGSLRRVNSEDLWVLTCNEDVVDAETVSKEDLLRFYLYIHSLPKDHPDALFLMYYEYLI
ncbi:E3 ubiquitin-protein ligase AIRP2 isoform B [Glycine soja]|uniref:E3 ubiquitin-protein ligase AIRP2 isoform B n=1 Tax=Glycine soja TaxID=3848 RepID=A0A445JCE0_GLYSO|nr:E3 ubiquitin-protein ligase AIRP2 isoform B [Glycine soja]